MTIILASGTWSLMDVIVWSIISVLGQDGMLDVEIMAVSRLMISPGVRNLAEVYFAPILAPAES